jgi:NAD-dependent deacetylase
MMVEGAPWAVQARAVASALRSARRAVALTGAGISVASGIPDFRSPGGLWSRFDPERVCSDWALRHNRQGVWEFLLDAYRVISRAKPNSAHFALAQLEAGGVLQGIVTQNIDNLHQEAGSSKVVEFHGNCKNFYCQECRTTVPLERIAAATVEDIPLSCACGGLVRPGVVFFGEQIPESALEQALEFANSADLVLIAGTSGEVSPANTFPRLIKSRGGIVVEVNLGPTGYADLSDMRIDGRAEDVLPLIADLVLSDDSTI